MSGKVVGIGIYQDQGGQVGRYRGGYARLYSYYVDTTKKGTIQRYRKPCILIRSKYISGSKYNYIGETSKSCQNNTWTQY